VESAPIMDSMTMRKAAAAQKGDPTLQWFAAIDQSLGRGLEACEGGEQAAEGYARACEGLAEMAAGAAKVARGNAVALAGTRKALTATRQQVVAMREAYEIVQRGIAGNPALAMWKAFGDMMMPAMNSGGSDPHEIKRTGNPMVDAVQLMMRAHPMATLMTGAWGRPPE
jgi:hypothetical protein